MRPTRSASRKQVSMSKSPYSIGPVQSRSCHDFPQVFDIRDHHTSIYYVCFESSTFSREDRRLVQMMFVSVWYTFLESQDRPEALTPQLRQPGGARVFIYAIKTITGQLFNCQSPPFSVDESVWINFEIIRIVLLRCLISGSSSKPWYCT